MFRNQFYRLKQKVEDWKAGRTWGQILDHNFNSISLLKQNGERRAEISISVTETLRDNIKLYWITIVLSVLIATFGLLQNSAAVIIGAMLIAPLMDPIQAMAFGMATGRPKLFWRSTRIIVYSVILSVFLAYLVCSIAPIKSETSEILARTSPNLFDLFIAILSAAVAFLAHGFSHLSKTVAGVAMAASLMPPLAVIGIELCFGNLFAAWGGFLLFVTNLVAILLVGTVMFIFYGFNPHQEQASKTVERITVLIALVFVIAIPLRAGVVKINDNRQTQIYTRTVLTQTLEELVPEAEIKQLNVQSSTDNSLRITGEIKLPENISLFTEIMDQLSREMSEQLQKDVSLELDIIRTATVISKQQTYSLENELIQSTRKALKDKFPESIILKIEVVLVPSETDLSSWSIKTIYALPEGKFISDMARGEMEGVVLKSFPEETLHFLWFPVSRREIAPVTPKETEEVDPEAGIQEALMQQWEHFLEEQRNEFLSFDNLKIQWSYIEVEDGIFDEVVPDVPVEETSSPLEGVEANIFEGILSGGKTKEEVPVEVVFEIRNKMIQVTFDIYLNQEAEPSVMERFRQALEVFKNSFDPDQVEVRYRLFEYQYNIAPAVEL